MEYKMIALDLDGTLTNSEKIITPDTKKALFAYQRKGGRIVLASGRPTQGIVPIAEELELEKFGGFILAFNGSRIVNCENEQVLFNQTLQMEQTKKLHKLAKDLQINILTYEGNTIFTEDGKDPYANIEQKITHMKMVEVEDISQAVTAPVNKCLITGEPERVMEIEKVIKEAMGHEINVYRSQDFFLELVPQNVDKAASLDSLLQQLGMNKEELIACGDGFNDLSMIQYAGLGVAMENAHADIKRKADFITKSNDADGVAYVLDRFVFA